MKKRISHDERAERRAAIVKEIRDGAPLSLVSKKYGVSEQTVRSACKKEDIYPRREATAPKAGRSTLLILKALLDGVSSQLIVSKFNVSKQYISQIKRNAESAGFKFIDNN